MTVLLYTTSCCVINNLKRSKMDMLLTANAIRRTFINYFTEKRNHQYVHSSSVIPKGDPSLLFTNAGMNQFKPIFLGTADPNSQMASWKRVVNSQKCIRAGGKHNDLDDVGKDVYHHTFFEMLGNWSFGDYFKKEICAWAWEVLTKEFKIPKEQLYVTYFGGSEKCRLQPDVECRQIWLEIGLPSERVLPFGMKDNFWEMGDIGPCGPCSEIHYDRIGNRNAANLINKNDPDVLEIWNLVFITYNRDKDGSLHPLPKRHIDCGLGFERLVSVIQGKKSNYDTDLFVPIFNRIAETAKVRPYMGKVGKEDEQQIDMAYRVVADHIRTLTVALSDGGRPDNCGRGYVLRRILRRGVRYATEKLNAPSGFFANLVPVVVETLGDMFPELKEDPNSVMEIINEEESLFLKTLSRGSRVLRQEIEKASKDKLIPGVVAWRLYASYGFPVDLTQLMAEESGYKVNMEEYEECRQQAQMSSSSKFSQANDVVDFNINAVNYLLNGKVPLTDDKPKYAYRLTENGDDDYEFDEVKCEVLALRRNGEFVSEVCSGDSCCLICDKTAFYAESGGQIYDEGSMEGEKCEFRVRNVQARSGYVIHFGEVMALVSIVLLHIIYYVVYLFVCLFVSKKRRVQVMKNHTATHLLNFALREVLGQVEQKGSLVLMDRLRFDFTCKAPLTVEQLVRIEQIVANIVNSDVEIYMQEVPLGVAKTIAGLRLTADEVIRRRSTVQFFYTALPLQTYPDPVRVVSVGTPVDALLKDPDGPGAKLASVEFCGGTHLLRTGHLGDFVIASEEAVARGIRRIVALTCHEAEQAVQKLEYFVKRVEEVMDLIRASVLSGELDYSFLNREISGCSEEMKASQIPAWRREHLVRKLAQVKATLDDFEKSERMKFVQMITDEAKNLQIPDDGIVVHEFPPNATAKALDSALKQLKCRACIVFSQDSKNKRVVCLANVNRECVDKGLTAKAWVDRLCCIAGGYGGGKETTAQASLGTGLPVDKIKTEAEKFAKCKLSKR
ncbi:Alanine--tRNA ligase, cytoplasmic [Trichinella sp. T9]|nr:Alanine--tRNA ligase, cytoplasmic [Trichinella sp. T9]